MPSFTQYIVRYCLFSGKLGNLTMHILNSMYICSFHVTNRYMYFQMKNKKYVHPTLENFILI